MKICRKYSRRCIKAMLIMQLAIAGCAVASLPVFAGDKTINVQGKLTNSAGAAITGAHALYFRIYTVATGGTQVWLEQQNVTMGTDGLFSVRLGTSTSIDSLPFSKQYYLGISVDGGTEMAPRQILSATPYALGSIGNFDVAKNLAVSGSITAAGGTFAGTISCKASEFSIGISTFVAKAGNIGIGMQPLDRLSVLAGGGITSANADGTNFVTMRGGFSDPIVQWTANGSLRLGTAVSLNTDGWSEKMRIASNGFVGINNLSPAYRLDVNGTIRCIDVSEISDARLKTDVHNLPKDTLDHLVKLEGITYHWDELQYKKKRQAESLTGNEDQSEKAVILAQIENELDAKYFEQDEIGLSAQEVEKIFPSLVQTDSHGYKSIKYSKLTVVLLEAIKAQQDRINLLEQRVNVLEKQ